MKKHKSFALVLTIPLFLAGNLSLRFPLQSTPSTPTEASTDESINWMTLEEALSECRLRGKLILVDIYTDWCGWCKTMDEDTFQDRTVIRFINKYYYPVRFNAEAEGPVEFAGDQYQLVNAGKKEIHTLAYKLLEGRLSYPSFVVLDPYLKTVHITKGYWEPEPFLVEIKWIVHKNGGL